MKIEEKISLAFFEILLVLLGAVGAIYYATTISAVRRGVDNALRGVAFARAAVVESLVKEEVARVRRVATSPALHALLDARDPASGRGATLAAAQGQVSFIAGEGASYAEIRVMNRDGGTVYLDDPGPPGDEVPLERLFKRASAGPAVSVFTTGGVRELLIAVPVMAGKDGRFLGVLAVALDARVLDAALEDRAGLGRTGLLSLFSNEGALLAPSNRRAPASPARGRDGSYIGAGGQRVTGVAAPLRTLGWTLRAEVNVAEAFRPVYVLRGVLVGVLVFIPALAALAGLRASRQITRPIKELLKGLRIVAMGDLDHSLDVRGPEEAGLLADAFNDMVAKIRSDRRLLDARVEERTRDLRQKTEELERSRKALIYMLDDMNELNERLRELYAIKSDFTSMVSHELRTPLTAIMEGITLVLDGTAGPIAAAQREFLGLAQKDVRRLTRLINNVLDLAKLETGKLSYVMEEHDLREIVREVVEAQRPVAREKGLALEASLPAAPVAVVCDRDRIIQVLTNLISNALKFTSRGGVGVGVEDADGVVTTRVTDTGVGIHPEEMGRLFRKFEQIPRAGRREPGGTGLGLAISKQIIEHHGGEMRAESAPGKGSTFLFTLSSGRPAPGGAARARGGPA